jgi:phosphoglycerate kinase
VRTVEDLLAAGVAGRRVLMRADLNVPLDRSGPSPLITDDGRIRATLPTLTKLTGAGARVVITAHLGRPKDGPDPKYSLAPVADRLGALLEAQVTLVALGEQARSAVDGLADGGVAVLENIRFDPRETSKNDDERRALAQELADLVGGSGPSGGAFVSDGFGVVHRKQASVYDIAQLLPAYAGDLVLDEVKVLAQLTGDPKRPYVVVLGGSKVSDKLGVISALLPRVDAVLVGGGMCFTFLAAQGHGVGDSLLEADQIDTCRDFLETGKIVLPTDIVVAEEITDDAATEIVPAEAIPDGRKGLDIGPASVARFAEALDGAATVFWNGPMGVFEVAPFAEGTRGVAAAIGKATGRGAMTVVGGGDSAAAIRALGLDEADYTHISTGGGASLEYLEGKQLPGLAVLE